MCDNLLYVEELDDILLHYDTYTPISYDILNGSTTPIGKDRQYSIRCHIALNV